ncbi:MAG TPA: YigZ family protein [bacterium]|nr:YigZ family protein [bacterium]
MDVYKTVRNSAQAELKVKGSKFIGQIFPVNSRSAADQKISEIKVEFYDAAHNCSAYRIGTGKDTLYYYDDDGEPSGTAGKPIFQTLVGEELTYTLLVVTRYFGGTKLGTGGLVRAYSETAKLAIGQANIVEKVKTDILQLQTIYEDISQVMRVIERLHGQIVHQDYGEEVRLDVAVRRSISDQFRQELRDATAGRIRFVSSP